MKQEELEKIINEARNNAWKKKTGYSSRGGKDPDEYIDKVIAKAILEKYKLTKVESE